MDRQDFDDALGSRHWNLFRTVFGDRPRRPRASQVDVAEWMDVPRLLGAALAGAALFATSACGIADGSAEPASARGGGNAAPDPGAEVVATAQSAVVGGASNISAGIVPNSLWESETAALSLVNGTTTRLVVAYNSFDTAHASGTGSLRNRCRYHSMLGVSYQTNGAWRGVRVAVPYYDNVSLLMGDPALTYLDAGTAWNVYASSLAMSDAQWNSLPKLSDGCVSPQTPLSPDNVCVTLLSVPKNGAALTQELSACMANAGSVPDGTRLYATSSGNVYTATWTSFEPNPGRVVVYQNFSGTFYDPFPLKQMLGHAFLVPNSGDMPTVIAPDAGGTFWLSRFDESSSTWSEPAAIAAGFDWQQGVELKSGTVLRQMGYAAEWTPSSVGNSI
ncbi:MAG TPA: hypothetical protein VKU41_08750, partial [Polyangiaceae bacterium]|nr:hypothetical protein [Polyangiaceae bacterium]